MALSSSLNLSPGTRFLILCGFCMIFPATIFFAVSTQLSDTFGMVYPIAAPISHLTSIVTNARFYTFFGLPKYTLVAGMILLMAVEAWSFHGTGWSPSRWNPTLAASYLVWPNAPPTFDIFILSFVIAFVLVHIVLALVIRRINNTDGMEAFEKITQDFQDMTPATRRVGPWPRDRELYDAMKVVLTGIQNVWLKFYLALTGRGRETRLPYDEGFIQDMAAPFPVEEIEVRITMSSTP